jgi:hypothetical protein
MVGLGWAGGDADDQRHDNGRYEDSSHFDASAFSGPARKS